MMKRAALVILGFILICPLLVGCVPAPASSSVQTEFEEVDLGGADLVEVGILMGAGELEISGGAEQLLEAEISYSDRDLRPDISYRVRGNGTGALGVEQDENPGNHISDSYYNRWELAFNSDVPLEMTVTLGAGESSLDLQELTLRSFSMQMGAGQAYIDLGKKPADDLDINIQGGVGELTVILPAGVSIEADVNGGLGEINASGLTRENGRYLSEYNGPGPVIRVFIEAGIGELNLLVQ